MLRQGNLFGMGGFYSKSAKYEKQFSAIGMREQNYLLFITKNQFKASLNDHEEKQRKKIDDLLLSMPTPIFQLFKKQSK